MTAKNSKRSIVIIESFLLGAGLLWVVPPCARAMDPDISRMRAGADRGAVQQEIELGAAYLTGRGVPRDEKQAAYWYEKAANFGDPGAQLQIGYFYQVGIGVERDPARAVKWFERAMAGGLIEAKVNLGVAYVWGLGIRKDPAVGARLFEEAAEKGNGTGACYLGDVYYLGLGVPKNEARGLHWYQVGAKLHDPRAEFNLAVVLARGNAGDDGKVAKLLRESAAAGYVPAKHQLGLLITRQPDLSVSAREGTEVLEEASAEGFWRSSVVLGILARDGRGRPKDPSSAYLHFRIAIMQGDTNTATLLANDIQRLSLELGEAQIKLLDAEAATWMKEHSRSLQFAHLKGGSNREFPAYALEYPQDDDVHAGRLVSAPDSKEGQNLGFSFR